MTTKTPATTKEECGYVTDRIAEQPGPFEHGTVVGSFMADVYPGCPPFDTRVEVDIQPFSITWNDRAGLLKDLAEVIRRYQI